MALAATHGRTEMTSFNARFTVRRTLGAGATGTVFLVEDALRGGTLLALKAIRRNLIDEALLAALRNEFFTLSQFEHPNLVTVFDFGEVVTSDPPEHRGDVFFTLEYVKGKPLLETPFAGDIQSVCKIIFQIAHALDYIHRQGLIHFDVKPDNILVTQGYVRRERFPIIKIIDFGFAAVPVEGIDVPLRGTLEYLAPELIRGEAVDHRADLYSLGVTAFQMLTGTLPFQGNSPIEIVRKHVGEMPPSVRTLSPDVPIELSDLVGALLEKDPAQRIGSALEVAEIVGGLIQRRETLARHVAHIPPRRVVGREKELETLLGFIAGTAGAEAVAGCPRAFCILGETGIGKTALLSELKRRALARGIHLIDSRCHSRDSAPYEPFRRILAELVFGLRTLGDGGARVLGEFQSTIGALRPDLLNDAGTLLVQSHADSSTAFVEEVARFFSAAHALAPFAVALDDIAAADESSLQLLLRLLRPAGGFPGSIVLAAESEGALKVLGGVDGSGIEPIYLKGLDEEAVGELTGLILNRDTVPQPVVEQLAKEIGGLPYVLKEVLRQFAGMSPEDALTSLQKLLSETGGHDLLPSTIAGLYMRRMNELSPEELIVLAAFSYFDEPVEPSVVQWTLPIPPTRFERSLDKLVKTGFLEPNEERTKYAFTESRFKKYINETAPADRSETHRRIAEALERVADGRGDDRAKQIAYHYKEAGEADRACDYYVRAAERARSLFAVGESIALLEEALRLGAERCDTNALLELLADGYTQTGEHQKAESRYHRLLERSAGNRALRYRYLKELAAVQTRSGHLDEAKRSLEEGASLASTVKERIEIEDELAAIDISRGRYGEARTRCIAALKSLEGQEPFEQIDNLYNKLGISGFYEGDFEEAVAQFSLALLHAERTADKVKQMTYNLNLGNVRHRQGRFRDAEVYWNEALRYSREVGSAEREAQILNSLGVLSFTQERYNEALSSYEKALEVFARLDNTPGEAYCRANIGEVHFAGSEYEKALECWGDSLALYESLGDDEGLAETHIQLAIAYAGLGDAAKAKQHVDGAREVIERASLTAQLGMLQLAAGSVDLLEGRLTEAERAFREARDYLRDGSDPANYLRALLKLGEADRSMLRLDDAASHLHEALRLCEDGSHPMIRAEVLFQLGMVAACEGSTLPAPPLQYLKDAFDIVEQGALCETSWKVCHSLGVQYIRRGLEGKGRRYLLYARYSLEALANLFADEEHRQQFLASHGRLKALREIESMIRS